MTTLIEVRDSRGLIGRCDAKCYDADNPRCSCVCGGANHGVGKTQAIEQTREKHQEWVEEFMKDRDSQDYETLINHTLVFQLRLPLADWVWVDVDEESGHCSS